MTALALKECFSPLSHGLAAQPAPSFQPARAVEVQDCAESREDAWMYVGAYSMGKACPGNLLQLLPFSWGESELGTTSRNCSGIILAAKRFGSCEPGEL